MSERVRVGIAGAGAVAQVAHLPILTTHDDCSVVAIADADRAKARTIADRFGVERVLSDIELFDSDAVDAVIIATPNRLHEEQAIRALEAGKHVLVERPLALTRAGVERMIETARDAERALMVGMSHRYRPDAIALHSFVAGGELGPVYSVRGSLLQRRVGVHRPTWRERRADAGGGAMMDLGVQITDLCLWLIGYPRIARVAAVSMSGDYEVEDAAALIAETENGIALNLEVTWSLFAERDQHHARVLGREGTGWLPPLTVYRRIGGRPMEVTPDQREQGENFYTAAYRRLLDRFVGAAAGLRPTDMPVEQAHLMDVIQAAYRSAKEQVEVRL
jgi:predicted dehydrogenase